MIRVIPVECVGITEDGRGFLERDIVLLDIALGFCCVPREHNSVYTLIEGGCQECGMYSAIGIELLQMGSPPRSKAAGTCGEMMARGYSARRASTGSTVAARRDGK